MKKILDYIGSRLKENSTRVAIMGFIVGITGLTLSPEQSEAIIGLASAVTLAVIAFLPEKPVDPAE
jgi:polysaccharide deacetylase 2 family uncharacterized protein YibQ